MKTKLEMAHEWMMKHDDGSMSVEVVVFKAWQYADAMQVEADKREDKKQAERIKIYADAFMNCEIQVIDEDDTCRITTRQKELDRNKWQPDWSQAPDDATAWEYLGHNSARWHTTTKGMYKSADLFGFGGTDMLILKRPK